MNQKHKILLFCMIFVGNAAFCQQYSQFQRALTENKHSIHYFSSKLQNQKPSTILRADFYCTQLGFFCKKELKLESATKIPFRFRLGSLQYNDWLEGKKSSGLLPVY